MPSEREPPRKVAKTSSKVAPIFAPKEKKEKPSPKTSSTSSKAPTKEIEVNRKGEKPLASIFTKATLKPGPKDDGEVSDEVKQKGKIEEEEDAIYDEIEDKQEGEAAVKLSDCTLTTLRLN